MAHPTAATAMADGPKSEDGFPPEGRVSRIRQSWAVFEDGALAQKLQSEEFEGHLKGNRTRNSQIRHDFPTALTEQQREAEEARVIKEAYHRDLKEQEERDGEVARKLYEAQMKREREQRAYEAARDEIFAQRLQNLERQKLRQPVVPMPKSSSSSSPPPPLPSLQPPRTPPLPVLADGDVPSYEEPTRGGAFYNDEEYEIKLARPAVVKAEPLYANNNCTEHYAVSSKFPLGAISKKKETYDDASVDLACAAGLLSQADIILSQKAEQLLEQQKRDEELAKKLQEELSMLAPDNKELLHQDYELAKMLQEKEKAKIRRAKERSRQKKLLQKQQQQQQQQKQLDLNPESIVPAPPENDSFETSRPGSRSSAAGRNSRSSNHRTQRSFDGGEEGIQPPARKPYMNTEAIDNAASNASGEEEPYYANIGGATAASSSSVEHRRQPSVLDDSDIPVPPYMPMQPLNSKKSSSMEKRINKKKEKEGCKQQ